MDEPIVFHCPTPHCETCLHNDCSKDEDEVRLCALLLGLGTDFSQIVEHSGNGGREMRIEN